MYDSLFVLLKRHRIKLKLTQKEVASKCDMPQLLYRYIENGYVKIPVIYVCKLSRILEFDLIPLSNPQNTDYNFKLYL